MAKVLVIDDDSASRHIMGAMLKKVGHEAHTSSNPSEAIHEALAFKPDVVVADWILKPNATGLEVVETSGASDPLVGVVFITGMLKSELNEQIKHLSRCLVVSKPCEFYELFEAIQKVCPK